MTSIAGWEERLKDSELVFDIVTKIMSGKADPAKYKRIQSPEDKARNLEKRLLGAKQYWAKLRADPALMAAYRKKKMSRSGQRRNYETQ